MKNSIFNRAFVVALIVSCGLGLSHLSFAQDLSGAWSGTGQWVDDKGSKTPCTLIEVSFKQGDQNLVVEKLHAKCGQLESDWNPLTFEIKGTKVYNDGDEVGTFDGHIFKTLMPDSGTDYAFNFEITGPNTLQIYYGVRNAVGAMVIEGETQRK